MSNSAWKNQLRNPHSYVPASLSELKDYMTVLLGDAPTFVDKTGLDPDQSIDSVFAVLAESFNRLREKLGDERYTLLVDLAARIKALFAADPNDDNGKTDEGYKLIWEMEDVIDAARRGRVAAKLPDEDGEITGD